MKFAKQRQITSRWIPKPLKGVIPTMEMHEQVTWRVGSYLVKRYESFRDNVVCGHGQELPWSSFFMRHHIRCLILVVKVSTRSFMHFCLHFLLCALLKAADTVSMHDKRAHPHPCTPRKPDQRPVLNTRKENAPIRGAFYASMPSCTRNVWSYFRGTTC